MRVRIVGFTKDGDHKELATLSEQQIHMTTPPGIEEAGLDGLQCARGEYRSGVVFHPEEFPEMVKFIVLVEK